MKRSPMKRSATPMKTSRKARPKINGIDYPRLCWGQQCYLMLKHVVIHNPATVVPAHSNQARHGKGMGLKASDIFTVPACYACHAEIDQGRMLSKEQKFAAWDAAYARWEKDREKLLQDNSTLT